MIVNYTIKAIIALFEKTNRLMKIHPVFHRIILCVFCCIAYTNIQAQETLRSLKANPTLLQYRAAHPVSRLKSLSAELPLELPFQDDFSSTTILPDNRLWDGESVFINSTYADSLPSLGIATFDIYGSDGMIYPNVNATSFNADTLTSKPIKLNGKKDVWLSFYCLPGGLGDPPSISDSLILEFSSDNIQWTPQWIARNANDSLILQTFSSITNKWVTHKFARNAEKFRLAMIPLDQASYLVDGFRFRFRNIASVPNDDLWKLSMACHWHIDYVLLDAGRNKQDTVYHDLAFYKPLPSLLNSYTSMPFDQFMNSTSQLKSTIEYSVRNNSNANIAAQKNIQYTEMENGALTNNYTIQDVYKDRVDSFSFYTLYPDLENPFITNKTKDVTYEIKCYFEHSYEDKWPYNDTVKYIQKFSNYFSYDDGTPESSYGIENANGVVAYGFNTYETDTLTAIQIYFCPTPDSASKEYYFKLAVWSDNKGKPGTLLYKDENKTSRQPTEFGKFHTYPLDTSVIIKTRFYVGWFQVDANFLNIGFDLNTSSRSNLFYNIDGRWTPSGSVNGEVLKGSLMLRPILGSAISTGVPTVKNRSSLSVYPNPASDYITISGQLQTNPVKKISFYSSIGQMIKEINNPQSETTDITSIPNGLYMVKIIFRNGTSESFKLLKK
jgi:hypothetical protein